MRIMGNLDPEKFLASWIAGTDTLLLNSLVPPAWLDMLNLLIFFFLPEKLKSKTIEIHALFSWKAALTR